MLRPGEYFAGYQILRKLGAGGMGAVYQARDRDLPRFVALKLLSIPDGGEFDHRVRFRREADTVARLQHPNIVTVYARGEDDDRLWIAMTFVDGSDVARALRQGAMHPVRAVRIISETAAALDHAHETGILHRDVKPANILLAEGRPERALLTDFGIAKAMDESQQLTRCGEILASFQYAAPERVTRPGEVDRRADVYSLGCTLFHMLTGEPPYPGQNVSRIIHGHAYEPVPVPSHRNPTLPRGFDNVIARAMAKEPERRFDNCAQLAWTAAEALQRTATTARRNTTTTARRTTQPQPQPPTVTAPPTPEPRQAPTMLAPTVRPEATGHRDIGIGHRDSDTGRRDSSTDLGAASAVSVKGGRTIRFVIGLALVVSLALVAYLLARADDGHPNTSPPTTSVVPITTTTVPVTTPTTPPPTTSEPPTTTTPYTTTKTTEQPPKTVAVPDVVGSPIATAKAQLEKDGFTVKQVQRDDKRTKGTVIETDPAAGTQHAVGSTITVYVSNGPAPTTITVPNLVGLSSGTASTTLQGLGWHGTLQQLYAKVTDPAKVGKVVEQTPPAGTTSALDSIVTVTIGQLTSTTPTS
ncbi:protein kinase domain-containing protein [Nocardia sp. CDC160]|uniref:protein kinase domain-containing protein n=1 Tax=Nocardia sp. CDC160 TaxID=3112166 RepID=UPI002DBB6AEA|nr:protein kinase [Nocardia sp. CDC160]MEC3918962.1 protein kinase [Nocardia sp. CDC160]